MSRMCGAPAVFVLASSRFGNEVRADAPARLVRLLDKVFEHPVVSVRAAGEHLGVSHPTARKDIALFEELGILAPTSDASYGRTWYCPELMRIIETEGVGGG